MGKAYTSKSFSLLKRSMPKLPETVELGFGTTAGEKRQRLVNPDGTFNVRRLHDARRTFVDLYHTLIAVSWPKFFAILLGAFIIENFIFATIYYLLGTDHLAGIIGTSPLERYAETYFFSSQTLTTLGYGRISPVGFWTSAVAAIESMIGLLAFALSTSLLWGRFSRPTAKILYSDNALVAPYRGSTGLMMRLVNARKNHLIEIEARMVMSRNEMVDGKLQRKFYNLPLELDKVNFLALSWTLVHPITDESPFHKMEQDAIEETETEIMVLMKAYDESYAQTVYSRMSYKTGEILCGAKFRSMIAVDPDGVTTLDMSLLNAYDMITEPVIS
jgi:inward rectifier potassium channel